MGPPRLAGTRRGVFAAVAALVVALDQATKHWALRALADGPIDLVGSLRLNLTFNDGSAFSLGSGHGMLISLIAAAVSLVVLWAGWRATDRSSAVGLGLVLGGAVGNLVDRAVRDGEGFLGGRVVDFVDLQWWPVFNLADTAIVAGALVLVLASWRSSE